MIGKALGAFGRFWLEFLVGDTPEVLLGVLVVVAVAVLLRHDRAVAIPLVPVIAALVLALSAFRGRRKRSPTDEPG